MLSGKNLGGPGNEREESLFTRSSHVSPEDRRKRALKGRLTLRGAFLPSPSEGIYVFSEREGHEE